jgi:hypothetical protein
MNNINFDKLIAQLTQPTPDEAYTDLSSIENNIVNPYYDVLNRDSPYVALRNDEITDEQAIAIIRKVSEFTTIAPELEGVYKAKVGQGTSCKDACKAVLDELADLVRKQIT